MSERIRTRSEQGWWRAMMAPLLLVLVLGSTLVLGACDLSVVNPSEILDEELDTPEIIPALVTGVISDYGYGLTAPGGGGIYNAGAHLTDELVSIGSYVGLFGLGNGEARDDWVESQSRWAHPAKARWVANDAIRRISNLVDDPSTSMPIATVRLYAGFANRALGDAFCDAVRDGGPLEPHTVYYEEAEQRFTEVIEMATAMGNDTLRIAGHAGRAQARMMLAGLQLRSWDEALADAAQVPTNFMHMQYMSRNGRNENGMVRWAFVNNQGSMWGTPWVQWGQNFELPASQRTGDVRIVYQPWGDGTNPQPPRPRWRARKWTNYDQDIPNVRGTEMRLIEGEAALVAGNWQAAVARINEVRQFRNQTLTGNNVLPMVSATNADEAWFLMFRERGIEMYLEGRRLPDLRRWAVTPGIAEFERIAAGRFDVVRKRGATGDPLADVRVSPYAVEKMCIEVSRDEKLSNPNIGGGR